MTTTKELLAMMTQVRESEWPTVIEHGTACELVAALERLHAYDKQNSSGNRWREIADALADVVYLTTDYAGAYPAVKAYEGASNE